LIEFLPNIRIDLEVFSGKLKWLISLRFIFALLLLGSTIAYQLGNAFDSFGKPIVLLYGLSGTIILLTSVYGLLLPSINRCQSLFVHVQIGIDTFCVTLIIYITGGYASLFSFLYLVVVTYSSVFVLKRETLLVAAFCSAQFAVLLILEINGFIDPFGYDSSLVNSALTGTQVLQKCSILTAACFSVAFLSGYLSDQERQSKAELAAMEAHLSRVQSLAQVGEMAAGLAHEIKNPLASLSGAIQILKGEMEENDSDNIRLMHIVLRETDRLSNLVNNFLTFARPSAGQAKCVDLGNALTEIAILFEKDSSVRQRIKVALTINDDVFVSIDPLKLHQVIWNLLSNGAEAIENEGQINILVRKLKNERVMIEITDNGCGMDEKTVKSIFNPFFSTKPNGTGLGLSIVYRILETYDCRLDVHSEPGLGSTFTLYFKQISPTNTKHD
jgi:two-component system sensor histidine kinase HydH